MPDPYEALKKATGIGPEPDLIEQAIAFLVGGLGLSSVPVPTATGPAQAMGDNSASRLGEAVAMLAGIPPAMKLFHGTNVSNLRGILRKGLQRSKSGQAWEHSLSDSVYATDNRFDARRWARDASHNVSGPVADTPAVLKLNIPDGTPLTPDYGAGRGAGGEGRFVLDLDVPPRWIETVSYQRPDGEWVEMSRQEYLAMLRKK